MARAEYKYTLLDRMRRLSYDDYHLLRKNLAKWVGVSNRTVENWMYARGETSTEIGGVFLLRLSKIFECEPIELYTTPPDMPTNTVNYGK